MENYKSFCGRVGFLCFFLGIFLLGHAKAENKIEPRSNVNLGPIQGWRSAYYCMMYNISGSCLVKDVLTDRGVVNVTGDELADYCKPGGCGEHTRAVLKCIHDVKRDFWFANNITVKLLDETIVNGCSNSTGFSTANYTSSGIKVYQKAYIPFISTVIFAAILNL